jgi:signal transduction histidine kinase
MLFLQHVADGSAEGASPRVPLDEAAAICLERALLSRDDALRLLEVEAAFAADRNVASWATRTAEIRLARTVNRADEAASWLSSCLSSELAAALVEDPPASSSDGIAWRLPALVRTLFERDGQLADFHARLEREKLDAMKELAYGASHEINNPLANIAARAQTLLTDERDPARRQKLTAIHRQAMRAHEMISDLMLYARPPKRTLAAVALVELVQQVVGELKPLAAEHDVQVNAVASEEGIEVAGDKTQLGVAIQAVLRNAIEAVDEGGRVLIGVRHRTVENAPWAEIVVCDNGPGISPNVRPHIFDPFFSGREAGRGLGFGLSKCWRIVTEHGGRVVVEQPSAGGAEIAILLPVSCNVEKLFSGKS